MNRTRYVLESEREKEVGGEGWEGELNVRILSGRNPSIRGVFIRDTGGWLRAHQLTNHTPCTGPYQDGDKTERGRVETMR